MILCVVCSVCAHIIESQYLKCYLFIGMLEEKEDLAVFYFPSSYVRRKIYINHIIFYLHLFT